jgi:hypothetical protein
MKNFLRIISLFLGIIIAGFQILNYYRAEQTIGKNLDSPSTTNYSIVRLPSFTPSISAIPTLTIKPTHTPIPTNTNTPTLAPSKTATPGVGDIVYEANWDNNFDGWGGDESWKVIDGMLLNNGASNKAIINAPYNPGKHNIRDYAIEVEIQAIGDYCGTFGTFGRSGYWGGIRYTQCYGNNHHAIIGFDYPDNWLDEIYYTPFNPGNDWHTYRLEVKGNIVKLFIDTRLMFEVTDNQFLEGGTIGLWSYNTQLAIKNFRVYAQ